MNHVTCRSRRTDSEEIDATFFEKMLVLAPSEKEPSAALCFAVDDHRALDFDDSPGFEETDADEEQLPQPLLVVTGIRESPPLFPVKN
ncbi:hypothetical protein HFX_2535 [Haloferax mediterranei ATCC 33500]|uniref:Uncharacterized protein n=1 Tax=Haloferax mediterranei (strain ATCC 33500 / DSM 1411 / JCM 8866 / NBRC 14739 / NCIMB 2177 / R-4) TaxID=523841 RepID=I3R7K5_HALMT|nr:hypothetical protein HFX_2535 [Haloferax mediterranei ATCC 33500]